MDVWKNTTSGNGNTSQKFVQFFIILDSKGDVSWDNSGLLVITGSISCKFQDFSAQVFKDGSHVDTGTDTSSLGITSLSQESSDSSNWELKTSLGGRTDGLCASSSLTLSANSFTFT